MIASAGLLPSEFTLSVGSPGFSVTYDSSVTRGGSDGSIKVSLTTATSQAKMAAAQESTAKSWTTRGLTDPYIQQVTCKSGYWGRSPATPIELPDGTKLHIWLQINGATVLPVAKWTASDNLPERWQPFGVGEPQRVKYEYAAAGTEVRMSIVAILEPAHGSVVQPFDVWLDDFVVEMTGTSTAPRQQEEIEGGESGALGTVAGYKNIPPIGDWEGSDYTEDGNGGSGGGDGDGGGSGGGDGDGGGQSYTGLLSTRQAVAWTDGALYWLSHNGRTLVLDPDAVTWTSAGYGPVHQTAVCQFEEPVFALTSSAGYDARIVPLTENVVDKNIPQMCFWLAYRTATVETARSYVGWAKRIVTGAYDGTRIYRGRRRRVVAYHIYGKATVEGEFGKGKLAIVSDEGYSEKYVIDTADMEAAFARRGHLVVSQHCTPAMRGRCVWADIVLIDTGEAHWKTVELSDTRMEYVAL